MLSFYFLGTACSFLLALYFITKVALEDNNNLPNNLESIFGITFILTLASWVGFIGMLIINYTILKHKKETNQND